VKKIREIQIRTQTIDEWRGVEIQFTWTPAARMTEKKATRVGSDEALRQAVIEEVMKSDEWNAYWSKPHFVECEVHKDGPEERVQVHKVSMEHFDSWTFTVSGGHLSALYR
jgi:hypothetical protein